MQKNLQKTLLRYMTEARFSIILFVILISITAILTPSRFYMGNLGTTLGLVTPLILASCAVTPVFLAGREGIDLSIGPLMGFIGVILVKVLILDMGIQSPFVIVPIALILGVGISALNGFFAVYIRVQPIVTSLGLYLMLAGLATWILPSPLGPVPKWLTALSEGYSVIPLIVVAVFWLYIKRMPLYTLILALGGEDRAVYAMGVNVHRIRIIAYMIGGVFATMAAISLTGLLGSADAQVGPNYTLLAIAAAALGGVSLAGGRGTMFGASIGAIDIFLLQNLITYFNVSSFVLQIVYGSILVIAVALNSEKISTMLSFKKESPHG